MDLGIAGRIALVTGGDSGIGWHTAKLLLEEGATVVLTDRHQGELDAAAARLEAPKKRLHTIAADLDSVESIVSLRDAVHDAVGAIDILVQSAGVTGAQGLFHEIDDAGWVDTLTTDLLAPVRVTRVFLPDLRPGGGDASSTSPRRTPSSRTTTSCPTAPPRPACWRSRRVSRGRTHPRACSSTASRRRSSRRR